MVDVSAKDTTTRTAVAHGFVKIAKAALAKIRKLDSPKGNPLEIARIAGISAAKRTAEWIPLCHPLYLTVTLMWTRGCAKLALRSHHASTATAQTGVEMEALVAVSAAALTVYDMCKALDKGMEIRTSIWWRSAAARAAIIFRAGSSCEQIREIQRAAAVIEIVRRENNSCRRKRPCTCL